MGFVCAHTFVRINLYAQDQTLLFPKWDSYVVFAANKNGLAVRAFERVSVLVLVLWSWVLLAERAFWSGAGAAAGVVSWQNAPVSADCARCGGAVSCLHRRRTFLFQPVACQRVVGFCLAIWVYAGVIPLAFGMFGRVFHIHVLCEASHFPAMSRIIRKRVSPGANLH